jgi:hypothetical protein
MCDCDTLLATDDVEGWQGICNIVNPLQLSGSHLAPDSLMLILMYDGFQEVTWAELELVLCLHSHRF